MKNFLFSTLMFIFTISTYAQNSVKGFILNETGKKLQKVSIQIKDTKFITSTDKKVSFKLENISDGEFLFFCKSILR